MLTVTVTVTALQQLDQTTNDRAPGFFDAEIPATVCFSLRFTRANQVPQLGDRAVVSSLGKLNPQRIKRIERIERIERGLFALSSRIRARLQLGSLS